LTVLSLRAALEGRSSSGRPASSAHPASAPVAPARRRRRPVRPQVEPCRLDIGQHAETARRPAEHGTHRSSAAATGRRPRRRPAGSPGSGAAAEQRHPQIGVDECPLPGSGRQRDAIAVPSSNSPGSVVRARAAIRRAGGSSASTGISRPKLRGNWRARRPTAPVAGVAGGRSCGAGNWNRPCSITGMPPGQVVSAAAAAARAVSRSWRRRRRPGRRRSSASSTIARATPRPATSNKLPAAERVAEQRQRRDQRAGARHVQAWPRPAPPAREAAEQPRPGQQQRHDDATPPMSGMNCAAAAPGSAAATHRASPPRRPA